jgi:two-component system, chemotaxis family, response regulator Rcp1
MSEANSPVEILLVEDNEGDVHLTMQALNRAKVRNRVHVASDGMEAMAFLRREPPNEKAPRPDVILLDLNLPLMDGREVLEELKKDPVLRTIPVVVMTTSSAEEDVVKSYALQANCYVTKPVDLKQFLHVVDSIGDFWLQVVRLPPRKDG